MSTVSLPQQQRIVLNVSWDGYVGIGEWLRDQPVRMTYDHGRLEIMTLSHEHEWFKTVIARLLEQLTLELNIEIKSGGSTTFRQEILDSGLEPDECYWIAHEEAMRHKYDFDPDSDPPPDLAVEIEISRSVLNRLGIYAGLGVPELWRYDGENIHILLLDAEHQYQPATMSAALPMVPPGEIARFLAMRETLSETQLIRQFRDWVREQQEVGWRTKKPRGKKKR